MRAPGLVAVTATAISAAAAAVAPLAFGWAGAGCGASHDSSAQPAEPPGCPATPEETMDHACSEEGLECAPAYTCGIAPVTLACQCAGGVFVCTGPAGQTVQRGDPAPCPAAPLGADGDDECPPTEALASFASCTLQGELCAYRASCATGVPAYDSCYCFPGQTRAGTTGLRWECSTSCDDAEGGPPAPSPGADGGVADAEAVDATGADEGPIDAGPPETTNSSSAEAADTSG